MFFLSFVITFLVRNVEREQLNPSCFKGAGSISECEVIQGRLSLLTWAFECKEKQDVVAGRDLALCQEWMYQTVELELYVLFLCVFLLELRGRYFEAFPFESTVDGDIFLAQCFLHTYLLLNFFGWDTSQWLKEWYRS